MLWKCMYILHRLMCYVLKSHMIQLPFCGTLWNGNTLKVGCSFKIKYLWMYTHKLVNLTEGMISKALWIGLIYKAELEIINIYQHYGYNKLYKYRLYLQLWRRKGAYRCRLLPVFVERHSFHNVGHLFHLRMAQRFHVLENWILQLILLCTDVFVTVCYCALLFSTVRFIFVLFALLTSAAWLQEEHLGFPSKEQAFFGLKNVKNFTVLDWLVLHIKYLICSKRDDRCRV